MINIIRNTVLSIISKDNRGYVTPEEFNLFSRQAQLDIFTQYMYDLNNAIIKQNARLNGGSGYSNVPAQLTEVLDKFLVEDVLEYDATTLKFYMPSDNPAQPDEPAAYKLERLTYNGSREIEKVSHTKALNLVSSNLTAPTLLFPVYTLNENGISGQASIQIYPTSIVAGDVTISYLRYPRDPKWTYDPTLLTGGEPIFNQSMSDFQDFEIPISDSVRLITLICKYAGVSVREGDVVTAMANDDTMNQQQKA
jgi:hypothetical protein